MRKFTKTGAVNNCGDNKWWREIYGLFTKSSLTLTELLTRLYTAESEEQSRLKTETAQKRYKEWTEIIATGAKYGWAHGLGGRGEAALQTPPVPTKKRLQLLQKEAVKCGYLIGKRQLEGIQAGKKHPLPRVGDSVLDATNGIVHLQPH